MQRRFIKKADIALIAVVLCVGAALLIWRFLPSNGKTEAVIYAGGEVYRRVTLDKSADMTITPDTDPKVVIKIIVHLIASFLFPAAEYIDIIPRLRPSSDNTHHTGLIRPAFRFTKIKVTVSNGRKCFARFR